MSPEEMRIAIAEALGWSWCRRHGHGPLCGLMPGDERKDRVKHVGQLTPADGGNVPNYTGNRDAAISAVVELCGSGLLKMKFIHRLRDELGTYNQNLSPSSETFLMLTATAEQICKALVKALNLEEGPTQ